MTEYSLLQELVERCAALSAKPDAIKNLIDAMDKLTDTYHDVEGMLKEIMELIQVSVTLLLNCFVISS